jgi:GDP-mannose 6-dehydrogenase
MQAFGENPSQALTTAVFGLGYVGTVTAGCLASVGHRIVGVDINPLKVEAINRGQSPIMEPGLSELIWEGVEKGRLRATASAAEAVRVSDISLVCVGTPGDENGGIDLRHVCQVAGEIGHALCSKPDFHVVVLRSTMLPGSARGVILPILEKTSDKEAGKDFGLCVNPEFLREGSSLYDFDQPSFTLIGEMDALSGDTLACLYHRIKAPLVRTDFETAEAVKYVSNTWHALKISFANEIGNICKQLGTDSHLVMDIFAKDTKLNISTAYLKPGFAFGGSCLPKDLKALLHCIRSNHMESPVLEAVLRSNELQVRRGVEMILSTGKKRVGVLGLSFKENTDDLRESPLVQVIETIIGKGYDVRVYDRDVCLSRLVGANRRYMERTVPHIASLLCDDARAVLDHAEVVVVGKRFLELSEILAGLNGHQSVVDLVRIGEDLSSNTGHYQGICW